MANEHMIDMEAQSIRTPILYGKTYRCKFNQDEEKYREESGRFWMVSKT